MISVCPKQLTVSYHLDFNWFSLFPIKIKQNYIQSWFSVAAIQSVLISEQDSIKGP